MNISYLGSEEFRLLHKKFLRSVILNIIKIDDVINHIQMHNKKKVLQKEPYYTLE